MAQDNAWQWDPTLFQGCAAHYDVGRIPYAEGLADALGLATPMHRTKGRLLDVGCGPGTIALRCAHLFDEVVGLDPDADMLREAARLAHTRGITNAQWVALRAEALPANLGLFRIVTFAASLHWLNRLQVFSTVRSMLVAGGVAVHVDNPGYRRDSAAITGWAFPSPPEQALEALRVRYLGTDRGAGQGIRNTSPDDEDAVFLAAGFAGLHIVTVPDRACSNARSTNSWPSDSLSLVPRRTCSVINSQRLNMIYARCCGEHRRAAISVCRCLTIC